MKHPHVRNSIQFLSLFALILLVLGLIITKPIQASTNASTAVLSLDANNNLLVIESGGDTNDPFTIRYDGTSFTVAHLDGGTLQTSIAGASGDGTNSVKIPASSVSGSQIIIDAGGGNDSLTIDIGDNTTPFTKEITFNGEGQTVGDALILIGTATVTNAQFDFTNETDGSIKLTNNATIYYTGLEPITSSIDAVNVTLNYGGSGEIISVANAGGGQTNVDSNIGGETVTFNDPTGSLTINAGAGDDSIQVDSLAASYPANLILTGAADKDEIQIAGLTSLGAGKNGTFSAETIGQSAALQVPGTLTLDAGSGGEISLTHATNNVVTLVISAADTADIVDQNYLILETITTETSFYVTSLTGGLYDGTLDESINVDTPVAVFRADTAIGDAGIDDGDLDIAVDLLAATTSDGDIAITDDGGLDVTAVDGVTGISITTGGPGDDILLRDGTAGGTEILDILEPISNAGSGDITIYADGDSSDDELEIEADISASGGDILLAAYGTVDFNETPTVSTSGNGTISIHAGATFSFVTGIDPTGGINTADLTGGIDYTLLTPQGDITLTSPDFLNVETTNADSDAVGPKGTVQIWADIDGNNVGKISDTQYLEGNIITAAKLVMRAATGIGAATGLETTVDTIVANNSAFGDIIIFNTGPTLATGSALGISGITNDSTGSIQLHTTDDLEIDNPISGNGLVSIKAGGDIADLNDPGIDISGSTVYLTGNVSPGGSGVGVLAIEGTTTLASTSGFTANLTGSTTGGSHDQLNVIGGVMVQSNVVFIPELSGYTIHEPGAITVIENSGGFSGNFSGLPHLSQLNPGNTPNFVVEYSSMVLRAYLVVAPTVSISYAAPTTATLIWDDYAINCSYTRFRSDQPYQGESAPSLPASSPLVDNTVGITNTFYTIRANGCSGDTALSNEVGVFHFEVTPGS